MFTIENRPDKTERIFLELELKRMWSTCQRGQVASALVNFEGVIIVPARNGTPYGQPSCAQLGADPDVKCPYCKHSEKNVISHAARLGIRTDGESLYTLKRPCIDCAGDIVQAGIVAVYYQEDYHTDGQYEYVAEMFNKRHIYFEKISVTERQLQLRKLLENWSLGIESETKTDSNYHPDKITDIDRASQALRELMINTEFLNGFDKLQKIAYITAVEKGWHNPTKSFGEEMMMMVTELSEAVEEYRTIENIEDFSRIYYSNNVKPEGIVIELADLFIRLLDTLGKYNVDFLPQVFMKMTYNYGRGHRHGNKRI